MIQDQKRDRMKPFFNSKLELKIAEAHQDAKAGMHMFVDANASIYAFHNAL